MEIGDKIKHEGRTLIALRPIFPKSPCVGCVFHDNNLCMIVKEVLCECWDSKREDLVFVECED